MPSQFIPNLTDPGTLAELRRLCTSSSSWVKRTLLPNNTHVSTHLSAKGVAHEFHVWDGRREEAVYSKVRQVAGLGRLIHPGPR
jgi:esterase/lipase superfamily enzyme